MTSTSVSIPFVQPWFSADAPEAVAAQVRSGFVGPGAATRAFCEALAGIVGARAVATVSGTVALSVAARALGLHAGDEVLLPAYGVISTANAFASIDLRPRLVDVDMQSACLTAEGLEQAMTPHSRAACFVNFSGYTGRHLVDVADVCARRKLVLIEDAAGALGHVHQTRSAGTFGDAGTYSFSVPKIVTTGQGGAVVSRRSDVLDAVAAYIDQGDLEWRRTNVNRAVGTNLRFTDLQAALGLSQLREFDQRLERRRATYAVLRDRLGRFLHSVPGAQAPLHNIVFSDSPDELVRHLNAAGVGAVRQYRTVSQHPAYAQLGDRRFPNSDWWTDHAVYLPFGIGLSPDDASFMADVSERLAAMLLPVHADE